MKCATVTCDRDAGDERWCEVCRDLREQLGVGRRAEEGAAIEALEIDLADDLHTINRRGCTAMNLRSSTWRHSRRGPCVRPSDKRDENLDINRW